jgi:hypothetical protein
MKKYTKSLLMAFVLASSAFAAHAADFNRSAVALVLKDDMTADFGPVAEFAAGNLGKTFSDTYTFSTTGLGGADSNVSWVSLDDTTGLQLSHFDLYKVGVASPVLTGTPLPDYDQLWLISGLNLTAGNYFLKIEGTIKTNDAITYSGNMVLSPVPEADAYAMLMAGLGVVGFVARRRKIAVAA